jgi:hypothetical protein
MEEYYSRIKIEFLDLCGTISVDELISNHKAVGLIKEISEILKDVSIIN